MNEKKLTFNEARELCIYSFLIKLNYKPSKIKETEIWFLSPLCKENTASFKISLRINRWYCHSTGVGGNIIDLVVRLNNCTPNQALKTLSKQLSLSFHLPQSQTIKVNKKSYSIIKIKSLENIALLNYLKSRAVEISVSKKYCVEIYYRINNKKFFAIAFKNNSDGMEIRNKYFKGSFGKKDITYINNNSKTVNIFEGFFDFLSYLSINKIENKNHDFIVLNSISLVNYAIPKIQTHEHILIHLDNDKAGRNGTEIIKKAIEKAKDCSAMYSSFKDLNEKIMYDRNSDVIK